MQATTLHPVEINCYYEALDDVFAFPSSPIEVPAFSDDQYEEYLGVYDQKEFSGKLSHAREFRHSQRACPISRGQKSAPVFDAYDCYQTVPSTFVPVPSRVKSTTPNLNLLFSLFDVLEEEGYESQSNTSSPSSGSEYSEVASSPPCVPSHEISSPVAVPQMMITPAYLEFPSHQWYPQATIPGFYPDKASLLMNFAELN